MYYIYSPGDYHCVELTALSINAIISTIANNDLDHAKKSFYRAANAIFGKVGRAASEEVVLQLLVSKCIPVLMYGLEVCPLTKSQLQSLDFTVNRFFMKLFKTGSIEIVKRPRNTLILKSLVYCGPSGLANSRAN